MAKHRTSDVTEKKRRSKKRKSRLEVSSSSESDSDVGTRKSQKKEIIEEPIKSSPPAEDPPSKPPKKEKKKKSKLATTQPEAPESPPPTAIPTATSPIIVPIHSSSNATQSAIDEEFSAIYLRKLTTEFADDLDKVREAPDFKASSVAMLIHALKQGESFFSAEEKRRMVVAKDV